MVKRMNKNNQEIKRDAGKPELSLVPMTELLNAIARVREYGTYVKGYGRESWREVSIERYIDALLRHVIAFADDPTGIDEESGLPHIDHVACNVAFILELMKDDLKGQDKDEFDMTYTDIPTEYIVPAQTPNYEVGDFPNVQRVTVGDFPDESYTSTANAMIHNDK